ncbi:diaminopimelate decarboxylase [Leifsonia sp. 98AMF]|uniref:diaminopimelate decarboxylase n=1 Tax=unclassified Leifsonia TaxID=2663824 RepID=UPI00087D4026|nr:MULTISPECIES: diaminopimelate decarboxylase [unclassified Leifsonia]SDH24141.1 diaminopimelate decarboxylase [Leifsonia sp. 197AMF]SDJ14297.1 diaminopimelate decarboxylase [Leifsonia sp. 466MF]SDJ54291.1 diaminopimelate decarboxylase [Leifsonia sp. 157MF]SDN35948.1 diaminopimelate decarboxylase [Leifsonia sp. 509MF]SEM85907.1 diaminopimelate decarboxylase [Leifsonia sp. 467MF]
MADPVAASNPLAPPWLHVPADVNALAPGLWSRTVDRDAGELVVGGLAASELAARFGTPLYVIDEEDARARAVEVREAFDRAFAEIGTAAKVYYAGKAFLSIEVARWMSEAGLNIDVCSGGELAVALAAGVDPERIGFHGNNKSLAEIDRAVEAGIGAIIIDSVQEIGRVAAAAERHSVVQSVRLRVNSGVHAHTHAFLATAHEDQKFGIALEQAAEAVALIRSHASLAFRGLHCHIGSQIFGADGFAESAARLLTLHKELLAGGDVPELNLGGGFGIAYTSADDPAPIGELARRIAETVAAGCEELDIPTPVVAFEPGRSIIGTAGLTLYTVGTTKDVPVAFQDDGETAVRRYVSVDGGMSDNARPALYGADYSARIANRVSPAAPALVRVAGKHCESGDIVVDAEYLPGDIQPGDLLAVPATGAYCWPLSSNYNHIGRPPVVAVRDGEARVIVRGETIEDLLARDAGYTAPASTVSASKERSQA